MPDLLLVQLAARVPFMEHPSKPAARRSDYPRHADGAPDRKRAPLVALLIAAAIVAEVLILVIL